MLKNSLFQPSLSFSFNAAPVFLFLLQRPFFFSFFLSGQRAISFSVQPSFFLSFVSALFSFFSVSATFFFLLQRSFLVFFQPYVFKVQPTTCCSLTQPKKPKTFCFSPKHFSVQPKTSFFSSERFLLQPKTFFSSAHTTVSASFCFVSTFFSFCQFCFQRTFSFCSAPPFLLSFSTPHSLFLANFQGQKYSLQMLHISFI